MKEFGQLVKDVMAYYGQNTTKFTMSVWWGACQAFDFEQVSSALQKHATDPERGRFAPKVADIVRALQGTTTDRAAIAWGKVHGAMSSVGAYKDVVFDDPAIHAVIEDLGGWPKICRVEVSELSYLQHRFQEAHKAYTERGKFDYMRRLPGDRSPDHDYASRGLPLPRPVLVGEMSQAMAVLQHGNAGGKTKMQELPAAAMRLLSVKSSDNAKLLQH